MVTHRETQVKPLSYLKVCLLLYTVNLFECLITLSISTQLALHQEGTPFWITLVNTFVSGLFHKFFTIKKSVSVAHLICYHVSCYCFSGTHIFASFLASVKCCFSIASICLSYAMHNDRSNNNAIHLNWVNECGYWDYLQENNHLDKAPQNSQEHG